MKKIYALLLTEYDRVFYFETIEAFEECKKQERYANAWDFEVDNDNGMIYSDVCFTS